MDRLEEQLRRLVNEACGHPLGSQQRQKLLTQIICLTASRLWRENTFYYQDALQQTWLYFCHNVCGGYDSNRGSVITWLNTYLRWRLRDFQYNKSPIIYQSLFGDGGNFIDPVEQPVELPAWSHIPSALKVSDINSCWVAKLCFPPKAGSDAAEQLLQSSSRLASGQRQNWMGGLSLSALKQAEEHALLFAQWLMETQTRPGFPLAYLSGSESLMGTDSGLSMMPYILYVRSFLTARLN